MKILRALFSLVIIAAIVFGSVYVYRSCSLKSCMDDFSTLRVYAADSDEETVLTGFSNVVDDLGKDPNFDKSAYPADDKDYSMQLLQIAESVTGSLFAYLYQPSGNKISLTSMRISTAIDGTPNFYDAELRLCNSNETLYKYQVLADTHKDVAVRIYDIAAVLRKWDKNIDELPDDGNTVTEVPYEINQHWTVKTGDSSVTYEMQYMETITVTDKYVSFIRYPDGHILSHPKAYDSHYVAFTTDKRMDKLMQAKVYYLADEGTYHYVGTISSLSSWQSKSKYSGYAEINAGSTASNPGNGWFAPSYTWQQIEKVSDFVNSPDYTLSESTKKELESKQWVLRFLDTDYSKYHDNSGVDYDEDYTKVEAVTILQLMFETDGKVYNLGVIDNYQSGDGKPSNVDKTGCEGFFGRIWDWIVAHWEIALAVTLVIVSVLVAVEILSIIWRK